MQVTSVTRWKDGAGIAAWTSGRVWFNRRGAGGLFDGWSALPDGTGERIETAIPAYPVTTHSGISDVSPDGRWMLVTVERGGDGSDGSANATPGRGTNNDLWLQEAGGARAWRLRNSRTVGALGLIWPRFFADGTKLVWSERYNTNPFYVFGGSWRLLVADIVWSSAGAPTLANMVVRNMNGLVEPYGATPDGKRILLCADGLFGVQPDAMVVGSLPVSLAGNASRLSPALPKPDFWGYNNYNEFAYPIAGTDRMIFGRTTGGTNHSLEYWTARWVDGSDPQQLTWFENPAWPFFHGGAPSLAGGLAFDPDNANRLIAGFAMDYADTWIAELIEMG